MVASTKGCCDCGGDFIRYNTITKRCVKCAIIKSKQDRIAKAKVDKEERLKHRKRKEDAKPKSHWMNKAQSAFNSYVSGS